MSQTRTIAALMLAFLLGIANTVLISGCQQASSRSEATADDVPPTTSSDSSSTAEGAATDPAADNDFAMNEQKSAAAEAPASTDETATTEEPSGKAAQAAASKDSESKVTTAEAATLAAQASAANADTQPSAGAEKKDNAAQPKSNESAQAEAAKSSEDSARAKAGAGSKSDQAAQTVAAVDKQANPKIVPGDWAQWGGSSYRNNVPAVTSSIPTEWEIGEIDRRTGEWRKENSRNVKWVSRLGSQTYGNPVVADGRVFVGTNNTGGYLKRYPSEVDLGVLLAFDEKDGKFLWQDSSEKLPTGRVHDWPLQGICSAPYVEGDRLWFVTSRGEVVCLDTEGFYDDEDDGPVQNQLGRLFDVAQNEDPAKDKLEGMLKALGEGKVSPDLAERFAASGAELPQDVTVKAEQPGKKWTLTANVGGAERTFQIVAVGAAPSQRLTASKVISPADKDESDRIWVLDMMSELQVSQHNMCSCSITALGDLLFINTSNGVDESHVNIPQVHAPSFICVDKNTGEVHWTDNRPNGNILHGQWSSPAVGTLGGVPQVIFGGGDGWLYSFKADKGKDGKPELLWEFDANPKDTKYSVDARSTRNHIIGTPVIYDGLVYIAVGEDPEHGEGDGHLWCIDPTKRGDVSAQLAVSVSDRTKVLPKRRLQAIHPDQGEIAIDNPNSAVVWHFAKFDKDGDGETSFEETMHRTCGTVAVKDDLLFIADFSGLFHCLDAKTGKLHWTYDMLAASWGSPLIINDKVYIGDEDGDIAVFNLSAEQHEPLSETNMENSVYTTPIVANNVMYIANKTHLFALANESEEKAAE